jgi:hypothetical protein
MRHILTGLVLSAGVLLSAAVAGPRDEPGATTITTRGPSDPLQRLMGEVRTLNEETATLRAALAEARLAEKEARRELAELRQFISDHRELGTDFQQYAAIKAIQEREARRRELDENRRRREVEKADRLARRQAAQDQRDLDQLEQERENRYRDAGFSAVGLNIYTSRMGFSYQTRDSSSTWVDYDPLVGFYYRPGLGDGSRIDYSGMTISGSVLNAGPEARNIGIALTFFDEQGNQVGSEIVQINNARPNVPYPFTSKVDMALDRPFTSSSTYVLFADSSP